MNWLRADTALSLEKEISGEVHVENFGRHIDVDEREFRFKRRSD